MHTEPAKKNRTSTPCFQWFNPRPSFELSKSTINRLMQHGRWAAVAIPQWMGYKISSPNYPKLLLTRMIYQFNDSTAAIPGCHFPFKSYAIKWDKMRGTGHIWPQLWLVPRCFQTRSFRSVAQEQVRVTGVLAWVMHTEKPTLCGWEILYK